MAKLGRKKWVQFCRSTLKENLEDFPKNDIAIAFYLDSTNLYTKWNDKFKQWHQKQEFGGEKIMKDWSLHFKGRK